MDKELEKYYEARFEMMATQGWKDLMDDIEGMINATDTLNGVMDEKTLHFRKGELSIMNLMRTLKKMSQESFEGLKNEDRET